MEAEGCAAAARREFWESRCSMSATNTLPLRSTATPQGEFHSARFASFAGDQNFACWQVGGGKWDAHDLRQRWRDAAHVDRAEVVRASNPVPRNHERRGHLRMNGRVAVRAAGAHDTHERSLQC